MYEKLLKILDGVGVEVEILFGDIYSVDVKFTPPITHSAYTHTGSLSCKFKCNGVVYVETLSPVFAYGDGSKRLITDHEKSKIKHIVMLSSDDIAALVSYVKKIESLKSDLELTKFEIREILKF